MLRQKVNVDGKVEKENKTRKRGCSSSSSSSLIRHYRLKRAVMVRKRGGGWSTPAPTWKMGSGLSSPACARQNAKEVKVHLVKDLSAISARKLAATLWEINDVASPNRNDDARSPVAELLQSMGRSKVVNHRRRSSLVSQLGEFVSGHTAGVSEIKTPSHYQTASVNTRLKDVSNGLAVANELLKVLNRMWVHEEKCSLTVPIVSALRFELKRAHLHVYHIIQENRSHGYEISSILKLFSEEKASWRSKEQDRIRNAIASIGEELKVEKKLRRQTERLNKKLGKELADTKASLLKACNELQNEKRARDILEQACDELARGIGEDRDEIEEMKRESAKIREEVEKEREMLQLADVLREERVQMKLLDAKYEFEEKNAAVEKMKSEVEAYLKTHISRDTCNSSPSFSKIKELEEYLWKTLGASLQMGDEEKGKGGFVNEEENEEDDSADSDLHSIELNVDSNSKSYNWVYARDGPTQPESKRNSVDGKIKGRRSFSEKTKRNIISLDRKTSSDGLEWDLSMQNLDGLDRGRLLELVSQNLSKDYEDEIERFEMVRDLRDHILSGARVSSSLGLPRAQHV